MSLDFKIAFVKSILKYYCQVILYISIHSTDFQGMISRSNVFCSPSQVKVLMGNREVDCVCPVRKRLTVVLKYVRISAYIVLFNKLTEK